MKPELERAKGVKDVQVLGGRVREMQVRVDLAALAYRGITIDACPAPSTTRRARWEVCTLESGIQRRKPNDAKPG